MSPLLGLQHELERFNDRLYAGGYTVDLSRYVVLLFLFYAAFSMIPAAVAMLRHAERAGRTVVLNAAAPTLLLLVTLALEHLRVHPVVADLIVLAIVCGGAVSWIATMIDASLGPPTAGTRKRSP